MHRYLHVSVVYSTAINDPKFLEPMIGELARDWVRYGPSGWVLWTDKSITTCVEMLRGKLLPTDLLLVLALSIGPNEPPNGIMHKWVWDWFNRYRDPATGWVYVPETPAVKSNVQTMLDNVLKLPPSNS
jgi:hypothetical protein